MIFSFKIFSEKCWVSMTGIIFSEERILIHVNIRCCGPVNVCFFFAAQNLFEIKLRLVCAYVKDLFYNDYRQDFRESFGRNTFYPLIRAV